MTVRWAPLVAVLLLPGRADARAWDDTDRLRELERRAAFALQAGELAKARPLLEDALELLLRSGSYASPALARTYLRRGILLLRQGNRDGARSDFAMALEYDPAITIEPTLASPDGTALLAEVQQRCRREICCEQCRKQVDQCRRSEFSPPAGDPPPPRRISGLDCRVPARAKRESWIDLRCAAAPSLGAARVVLGVRRTPTSFGARPDQFLSVPLPRSPNGWWAVTLPMRETLGRQLEVFFEAFDEQGTVVATVGSAAKPRRIVLR